MKILQNAAAILTLVSLLGIGEVAPLCASCGPAGMACCQREPSATVTIGAAPCCPSHGSVSTQEQPARMASTNSGPLREASSFAVAARVPGQQAMEDSPKDPSASPPPRPGSPPLLFILNVSLLR